MRCPNCQCENIGSNDRCEYCGNQLINNTITLYNTNNLSPEEKKKNVKRIGFIANIVLLFMCGPFLLAGIFCIGVGVFSTVNEANQTKNYEKKEALLIAFDDCNYNSELGGETCKGIYEFEVNGIKYTVSPTVSSNWDAFEQTQTVYYDPINPNNNLIRNNWNFLFIVGIICISINIPIFIIKTLIQKAIIKNI